MEEEGWCRTERKGRGKNDVGCKGRKRMKSDGGGKEMGEEE
jgi:hypothetical protein